MAVNFAFDVSRCSRKSLGLLWRAVTKRRSHGVFHFHSGVIAWQPWKRGSFMHQYWDRPSVSASSDKLRVAAQLSAQEPTSASVTSNSRGSDINVLRNFNSSKQYSKTIEQYESLYPDSLKIPFTASKERQEMLAEYITALLASNQKTKLQSLLSLKDKHPTTLTPTESTPTLRLRLEDNANQPLKVTLKPPYRYAHFLTDILKYTISSLFFFAAASIVIERVAESLPKGLGFGVGKKVDPVTDVKETLDDVKGCSEVKEELEEIIEYLGNPQQFTRLGAKLPKGVLLAGPPGTGKTLLARAIAGEAKVPFIQASAAEFEEMFVGVGARRVRDLFSVAQKIAPVIIFIDEIDAVGSKRAFKDSSSARMTLNQLLVELDGFTQNKGVVVICATNSPESLDPALTRPGRLDKIIHVPLPDLQGREEILRHYGDKVVLGSDVNLRALARITVGMTGADLFNLVNIAAIRSSVENQPFISMKSLELALDRVMVGLERRNPMSMDEKRVTSIHEAGHTITGWFTSGADPVYKATIMPRGSSLGITWHAPDSDRYQRKLHEYQAQLMVSMGGRAAEELIFGSSNVTSGSSGDLKSATALAREMVMHSGFGLEDGKLCMYIDGYSELSNTLREKVDTAVQQLLNKAYEQAKTLLKTHVTELLRLSEALLEYETLNREEIQLVLQGNLQTLHERRQDSKPSKHNV